MASVSAFTAEEGAPGRCGPRTSVGKRSTRDQAAVRKASPLIVTAWRNKEAAVEVTRSLAGPGMDAADWALEVRR